MSKPQNQNHMVIFTISLLSSEMMSSIMMTSVCKNVSVMGFMLPVSIHGRFILQVLMDLNEFIDFDYGKLNKF